MPQYVRHNLGSFVRTTGLLDLSLEISSLNRDETCAFVRPGVRGERQKLLTVHISVLDAATRRDHATGSGESYRNVRSVQTIWHPLTCWWSGITGDDTNKREKRPPLVLRWVRYPFACSCIFHVSLSPLPHFPREVVLFSQYLFFVLSQHFFIISSHCFHGRWMGVVMLNRLRRVGEFTSTLPDCTIRRLSSCKISLIKGECLECIGRGKRS